jgi:hypothetical protein
LLDGRAYSAGELARSANVSAASASMHLAQLLQGGLVQVSPQGRHRYYRIASPAVAHAVEALGAISTVSPPKPSGASDSFCQARTCYDHLAGELAVSLAEEFERQRWLVPKRERDYEVTPQGEAFLAGWKIEVGALRAGRRNFASRCLDWTERRDHLAGALGAAVCDWFFSARWVVRERQGRTVHLTLRGRQELEPLLKRRLGVA